MLLEFSPHIFPTSITILQHIELGNKQKFKNVQETFSKWNERENEFRGKIAEQIRVYANIHPSLGLLLSYGTCHYSTNIGDSLAMTRKPCLQIIKPQERTKWKL